MNDTKKPTVSIGMPVYNGEKYIKEALDSLLVQTYGDFELIISDNASTDSTQAICEEYASKDSRIRYIRQNENIGASKNFQFVLDESVGEYFMWAAHDDLWGKNFIENGLSLLFKDSDIGFVFPSFQLVNINQNKINIFNSEIFNFINNNNDEHRILSFANLRYITHKCNLVYSLFRIDLIRKALIIQEISKDDLLSVVILKKSKGALMRDYLFYKRYQSYWPGDTKNIKYILNSFYTNIFNYKKSRQQFKLSIEDRYNRMKKMYPSIGIELELIKNKYISDGLYGNFKIIDN